jgi:hypothetical protein
MLNNADNPNDIEFVSYHDDDDDSVYEYVGNHREITGPRLPFYSQCWNDCAKIATGDIYLYNSDDIQFVSKGWDTEIKDAFDKSKDKIIFVYFNDKRHVSSYGCIYCVHKNWIDTVGYLTPGFFSSHYPDNWMNALARRIDRKVRLDNVKLKLQGLEDKTHKEYLERREKESPRGIYQAHKPQLLEDARKLKQFISDYEKN